MTADVRDRLRQLTEAHGQATKGPWEQDRYEIQGMRHTLVAETGWRPDAAAIVAAHNATPWLVAALTAVLDLHKPVVNWGEPECEACSTVCLDDECLSVVPWPCPTVRAVVAAAGGEGE